MNHLNHIIDAKKPRNISVSQDLDELFFPSYHQFWPRKEFPNCSRFGWAVGPVAGGDGISSIDFLRDQCLETYSYLDSQRFGAWGIHIPHRFIHIYIYIIIFFFSYEQCGAGQGATWSFPTTLQLQDGKFIYIYIYTYIYIHIYMYNLPDDII